DDPEAPVPLLSARKTRRWASPHALKNRSKYAVRPIETVELGNHFVWEFAPGSISAGVPVDRAMLHHYRKFLKMLLACSNEPLDILAILAIVHVVFIENTLIVDHGKDWADEGRLRSDREGMRHRNSYSLDETAAETFTSCLYSAVCEFGGIQCLTVPSAVDRTAHRWAEELYKRVTEERKIVTRTCPMS
ncbi:hypothetical protein EVAR_103732_1, partial [Eumeta japonica]